MQGEFIEADVTLLPTEQGGRKHAITPGVYRPHLRNDPNGELLGVQFIEGDSLAPGGRGVWIAELMYTDTGIDYSSLVPGSLSEIIEGHAIGHARVIHRWTEPESRIRRRAT